MEKEFNSLADTKTLDELIARSHNEPVILFKHSTTCPISSAAYREMSKVADEVAMLVVQKSRDVSNEIAKRTGIRHETPQTLILRNGEVVWSASHFDITSDVVTSAARENA